MPQRSVSVSKFKAQCLSLLNNVAETGEELLVTKRGKPLARVVSVSEPPTLRDSVTWRVSHDELVEPIDEPWDAATR